MTSITFASTLAMAVGLGAALPQILRMLLSRSASGQSQLGWGMGLVANASMAYVNLVGFHAQFLAASNVLSGSLCVVAMVLIGRFAATSTRTTDALDELATATVVTTTRPQLSVMPPVHATLADLPTTEFVALRAAIDEIDAHRADQARRADKLEWAA